MFFDCFPFYIVVLSSVVWGGENAEAKPSIGRINYTPPVNRDLRRTRDSWKKRRHVVESVDSSSSADQEYPWRECDDIKPGLKTIHHDVMMYPANQFQFLALGTQEQDRSMHAAVSSAASTRSLLSFYCIRPFQFHSDIRPWRAPLLEMEKGTEDKSMVPALLSARTLKLRDLQRTWEHRPLGLFAILQASCEKCRQRLLAGVRPRACSTAHRMAWFFVRRRDVVMIYGRRWYLYLHLLLDVLLYLLSSSLR